MNDHFDIAVLGAGPAGATAAIAAAQAGQRVVLIDEQPAAGGQVWRAKSKSIVSAPQTPEGKSGDALRSQLAHAASNCGLTHFTGARLWQIERGGSDAFNLHVLVGSTGLKIEATALVLATGAREFVQPVPGWTLPGVLGLAGVTALLKSELTPPGKATVVSGTGPLVFFAASEIRRLGGNITAIATPNRRRDWLRALPAMLRRPKLLWRGLLWMADLMLARVPIMWGHTVTCVRGTDAITSVEIKPVTDDWTPHGKTHRFTADNLCLGQGLIPSIEAAQLAGLHVQYDIRLGGWVPQVQTDGRTAIPNLFVCGDGGGIRGAEAAEIQGELAGLRAAAALGATGLLADIQKLVRRHRASASFGAAMTALSIPRKGMASWATSQTILCRCERLTHADVRAEIQAGANSTNAVKSGLRAGMGPCGGKFCQTAVADLIAQHSGAAPCDVPPPTPRPPLRPVPVSAMAEGFEYGDLPIPKPAPL